MVLATVASALTDWIALARREARPHARILLFRGTPRAESATLERQLRWLKRRFSLVPLRSIVAAAQQGGAVEGKLAVTFDAGLRSHVTVAYPLLHRLAIPATFFVCPGLVDRGGWLWTHETRRRLARLAPSARGELAVELGAPHEAEPFVEWMKARDPGERRRVEARLREATPRFVPTPEESEAFDLASWQELRKLDPALVTIGSHALTPIEVDVRESRRRLEDGLQRPVDFFAYPDGGHNAAAEACVRRHYRAAVTTTSGWVRRGADTHRLPRLSAPPGVLQLARNIYA